MPTATIRRDFLPSKIRVIDEARGIVDFIATSAAVDSYGEVVDPKGADLSRFEKNAPVIDSHNYSSVDNLLGKSLGTRMEGGQLIITVQFAVDVAENTLAKKAFAMVKAGYLKACSIGFIPQKVCRRSDSDFQEACKDLGLGDLEDSIQCVYQAWQLLELSICCIGANPEAVAKGYKAGIFEDADLLRWPTLRRSLQSAQTQPATPEPMSSKSFGDTFLALCKPKAAPTVTQAVENLEFARRGQSETELFRATAMLRYAMARQRRMTAREKMDEILSDPPLNEFFDLLPRYLARMPVGLVTPGRTYDLVRNALASTTKSLVPGSGLGGTLLPGPVSDAIWDLTALNGAWREMGVVEMTSQQTKVAQGIGLPSAVWITPSNIGLTTIPSDTALTGTSLTPSANTLGIILPISNELLADEKANLNYYLLGRFSEGLAASLDYVATQGNGNDDQTNGKQTGLWLDNTISTVTSDQGASTIAFLARADFLKAVAAISPAALQRPCKWVISTAFMAPLMTLVDGQGREYLLKTPAETGDDTWRLVGFEVVWAAQAPAVNQPGSTIAAFGHLPSYQVGIRTEIEVMMAEGATGFQTNTSNFRALCRAFCQTRAATGLAKLQLSPN